jgi:hypothetical protein
MRSFFTILKGVPSHKAAPNPDEEKADEQV